MRAVFGPPVRTTLCRGVLLYLACHLFPNWIRDSVVVGTDLLAIGLYPDPLGVLVFLSPETRPGDDTRLAHHTPI